MFLNLMNDAQKKAFLVLAHHLMAADGEDSADEMEALEELRKEMDFTGNVDMKGAMGRIDVSVFDSHKIRVVAALELLMLAYADEYVHEAEIETVRNICTAMGFDEEWLSVMGEWATNFNAIRDEPIEGELADYHEAMINHANEMMNVG